MDTSSRRCSVALGEDGQLVCEMDAAESEGFMHAEALHLFIQQVLETAGWAPDHLQGVAVGLGPGSYTGLRIGASAAKGLAYALKIPVLGTESLRVQAFALREESGNNPILSVLDARRDEVYAAIYSGLGETLAPVHNVILEPRSFENWRKTEALRLIGDCTEKCREILGEEGIIYHPVTGPRAADLLPWAELAYQRGDFLDTAYFEPLYFKEYRAGSPKKPRWAQ